MKVLVNYHNYNQLVQKTSSNNVSTLSEFNASSRGGGGGDSMRIESIMLKSNGNSNSKAHLSSVNNCERSHNNSNNVNNQIESEKLTMIVPEENNQAPQRNGNGHEIRIVENLVEATKEIIKASDVEIEATKVVTTLIESSFENNCSSSWKKTLTNSIGFLRNRSSTNPDISSDSEKSIATDNSRCQSINALQSSKKPKNKLNLVDTENKSPWDILCQIINCKVAFKKQYNGKKYNWIQLAGHAGRFKPGEREGFILKLMDNLERACLEMLKLDSLRDFVPQIDKVLLDNEDSKYYTEMQDLLYGYEYPSIMDIKIGVRTFLENDNDEKETKSRNDLYQRLIEMAPDEPTPEEHRVKAITKRRYMSWREKSTCSATLGFRIEAIKKNQVSEKEFYSVKTKKEVQNHFKNYTDNKKHIMKMYLNRLVNLKECLLKSDFFYSHEMIGSSLLFVHDDQKASIWMIDFGKTRPLPDGIKLTHEDKWIEGNHEDGYLIGIQSLIDIFQDTLSS